MAKTFRNFIGGEWVAPAEGRYFQNRNPADHDDLIGRFPTRPRATSTRPCDRRKRGLRSGHARPHRFVATCSAGWAI